MRNMRILCSLLMAFALQAQMPEVKTPSQSMPAVKFSEVVEGTGEPAAPGKQYTLHYSGWLTDGKKFDSSLDRKEPFSFVQGRRQVIPGFEQGFDGMRVGGKRRIFIPYQLAYGEKGSGPIPPKSDLIFDIELLAVKDVPQLPAAVDLIQPLTAMQEKVVALAKAVPEEKYSWRPAEGVRSFREAFIHIANGNLLLLAIANDSPTKEILEKRIAENAKREKTGLNKEQILKMLTDSFASAKKALEAERNGGLGRDTEFFGTPTIRRGVYVILDTHIAEHMGQLIAYARMNGITPPWSR